MFLEFSLWHVFWKTDITRIFQICMCTAVEWSAICLPWVSPSAYGASQLLGFGYRFGKNGNVMGGIGKTQQCNLSDSPPSCQLQYVYSIDKWRSWKQSHLPIRICANPAQKHLQSILKSLEYETQIMATSFFLPRYSYKRQECVEGIFWQVVALFFHFNSPMMKWNNIIWGFTLDALADRGNWKSIGLNAGAWTWTRRDVAVGKTCKAQSAVLCRSQVYSFYVVIL